jgi:hypothetical protein
MVDGMSCWEMLGALIAWEAQDPELLAEHFLTVASYNLQHPAQFTDAAITGLRASFTEHLDHGLAVVEIRRRMRQTFDGPARVLKLEAERKPMLRRWSTTIADVYWPDQPQGAAARVRAWAAGVRREMSGE